MCFINRPTNSEIDFFAVYRIVHMQIFNAFGCLQQPTVVPLASRL